MISMRLDQLVESAHKNASNTDLRHVVSDVDLPFITTATKCMVLIRAELISRMSKNSGLGWPATNG